jgi:DNA repair protein RecO (recombination protein O)
MIVSTRAIVISALKYGEADLIVKCFTEKSGLKTYLLRGVLKSKKGKFRASLFQSLSQLEIVAKHKDKGTMEYLQEAKIYKPYATLHTEVVKSTMVMFISEVLKNSIQEEEENAALYQYLEAAFDWLDTHEKFANFHLLFLLRLTRYLGFYPDDTAPEPEYFNMLEGVFQQQKTSDYCIAGSNVEVLRQLMQVNFSELNSLKFNKATRNSFLEMLLSYYQLHIDSFKRPKSLAVLHEIFH